MGLPRVSLARARLLLSTAVLLIAIDVVVAAVPPGYRYIGSRTVSNARVVLWYWNPDLVDASDSRMAFAARLYARAVDVDQERHYAAIVRCSDRSYRPAGETGPFLPVDDGEPIAAVWRAGCVGGVAVSALERRGRLEGNVPGGADAAIARAPEALAGGTSSQAGPPAGASSPPASANSQLPVAMPPASANSPPPVAMPPAPITTSSSAAVAAPAAASTATAPAAEGSPAPATSADPRRVDACVRFSEARSTPAGDATITNVCTHPVEVSLCYKDAGGGRHDCGTPVRGRLSDSLGPGVTHVLPEYRRGRHRGIAAVACRGSAGTVFPRLEEPGRSGCN